MERIIHKLLLAWVLLLGASVLTQALPFAGSARVGYWVMGVAVLTGPVAILLLFLMVVLGLREAFHRLRVLRRAARWKRKKLPVRWTGEEWDGRTPHNGRNPR